MICNFLIIRIYFPSSIAPGSDPVCDIAFRIFAANKYNSACDEKQNCKFNKSGMIIF